jgi:hypothetical protein
MTRVGGAPLESMEEGAGGHPSSLEEGVPFDLDPEEGAAALAEHFPIYVAFLRASGVIKSGTTHRGAKLAGAVVLQLLHAWLGYVVFVKVGLCTLNPADP